MTPPSAPEFPALLRAPAVGAVIIAVATHKFSRIAGHAGQARDWIVFECRSGRPTREVNRVRLGPNEVFHRHRGGAHPLDHVHILIAGSAGERFLSRMRRRGVQVALTAEQDIANAAEKWLTGRLPGPEPMGLRSLICRLRDRFSPHRD